MIMKNNKIFSNYFDNLSANSQFKYFQFISHETQPEPLGLERSIGS